MGAKTALLAYSAEPLVDTLRSGYEPDKASSDRLIELIHPGATWNPLPAGSLADTYPAQNVALTLPDSRQPVPPSPTTTSKHDHGQT